ncbi:ThiF family adenylyltransferase [Halobacillus sp. Marseille-Q1614]|uniref:ThiF family adenylyltransferase n=1 Tax=Halobacillus sp. Marseille-Q1614 TaxID=2709134 RepID=UPI001570FEDC|nr:ThiF family adenylyltransferase [Halobacillus sp. Marseille-Q1614]
MESRYSRQELFSPIGQAGQEFLAEKHVLIVGAGALGSANAEMLARAGVSEISIIDRDYIEMSNLNRQQLYTEEDAYFSLAKAEAAKQRLRNINSEIKVNGIVAEFDSENAESVLEGADLVIDGTDNFSTRFLINDAAAKRKMPWIYGGCVKSHGVCLAILPGETPCLQCLMDVIPQEGETCDSVGIIGPAVQMTAAHQTTEALKILTNQEPSKEMLYFDVWGREYSSMIVSGLLNPDCASCSPQANYPYLRKQKGLRTAVLCGRDTVQVRPDASKPISLKDLAHRLKPVAQKVRENKELIVCYIEGVRFVVFKDGRTLIHGAADVAEARKMYQRFIGA